VQYQADENSASHLDDEMVAVRDLQDNATIESVTVHLIELRGKTY